MTIYRCKCGFEGHCYGTPTSKGVSAPWCPKCEMNNGLTEINVEYQTIKNPDYKWIMLVCGDDLIIRRETAPNWFHRKMQELVFGFKWERVK